METLENQALSIAEISKKLKIPKHTLRFWEKEFIGTIVPLRTQGGQRRNYIRKPFKLEELEIVIKNASEKIALIRENKSLLQRLKETVEEMNHMKKIWEEHLSNMVGLYSMVSPDQKISEMELILSQLNPVPPDQDIPRREFLDNALPVLEKLIQFRKEGLIDESEFLTFKKMLLKNR